MTEHDLFDLLEILRRMVRADRLNSSTDPSAKHELAVTETMITTMQANVASRIALHKEQV